MNNAPERTALLVIDMENDFVRAGPMQVPGAAALADRLAELARRCRAAGALVVYVRQALRPGGEDLGHLARFEPIRAGEALREGSPGTEIVAELAPQPGDVVVTKRRFSAFLGTDLDLLLRSRGIDCVVVSGISAHVCCDTTARDAAQLGYEVIYLSDGTEMGDLPDLGWGAIPAEQAKAVVATIVAHRFGRVSSISELLAALEPGRDRLVAARRQGAGP